MGLPLRKYEKLSNGIRPTIAAECFVVWFIGFFGGDFETFVLPSILNNSRTPGTYIPAAQGQDLFVTRAAATDRRRPPYFTCAMIDDIRFRGFFWFGSMQAIQLFALNRLCQKWKQFYLIFWVPIQSELFYATKWKSKRAGDSAGPIVPEMTS